MKKRKTLSPRRRFAYRLALMMGEINVDAMLRKITAKQYMEWELFAKLEPWMLNPELRADWRAAAIVAMIHNVNVQKKHQKPIKDFVLPFEKEEKKEEKPHTPEQVQKRQKAMLEILTFMQNAAPGTITLADS